MMTPDEMIVVIKAYNEGKQIQVARIDFDDWENTDSPVFNFQLFKYRIKPEKPGYRPFKDGKEAMDAIREHGAYIAFDGYYALITAVFEDRFYFGQDGLAYYDSPKLNCTFADGTPFGVKED